LGSHKIEDYGKKCSMKNPAEDLRYAENETQEGDLLEDSHAQPLTEFHHSLLMPGGTEVAALAGKGMKILMVAVLALHPGKTVV
jgi:hypothetical protein